MNMVEREPNDNLMLVTTVLDSFPSGGRELLCRLNYDVLHSLHDNRLLLFELKKDALRGTGEKLNAFRGYIDGLNTSIIAKAIQNIREKRISRVFVDGSNLGALTAALKCEIPQVEIITFFHNVESRFFLGSFRQQKSLYALAILLANYLAERKAVKYSDKLICLSERDSQLLKRIYGRQATHISPMVLQDKLLVVGSRVEGVKKRFALFVGGTFYANRAGITWFVKHVAPYINIKTYIVGRGFEDFKDELELDGKVEVIGGVDSLAQWYSDAYFVIAPIFDGSGMKTKVAEALMFGKKIIGTPEAFSGYEDILDHAGCVCISAQEFIEAIEKADEIVKSSFDVELRKIYEERYSYEAAKSRMKRIMCS